MRLIDKFNRTHNYLRISLTERCNLRCVYCMPSEGIKLSENSKILTSSEIHALASKFVKHGVNKIRLTGGEPTVRADFMDICKNMSYLNLNEFCITSNGIALPRKLPKLKEYGLTGVNISLDTLVEAKFNFFTRRQGLQRVLHAIDEAIRLEIKNVKVNCVVMRNQNFDEIIDFVNLTKDKNVQIRFIEYMPFSGNKWHNEKMVSYFEMVEAIKNANFRLDPMNPKPGETSKNYYVFNKNGERHLGSIGFISSMTSGFCSTCNRMRITADGNLKVCLFGNEEVSLRDMLRSNCTDEEISAVVTSAISNKKQAHAGIHKLKKMKNRPMILIGGMSTYARRAFSTAKLSHVDSDGSAHMVDVGSKPKSKRVAKAFGTIKLNKNAIAQIRENTNKKGDVLGVARIAGIMAVKQTPQLIPLCHVIPITKVKNELVVKDDCLEVLTTVECVGQTGVEMEALIGANITLSTVYDMCKAVDKNMVMGAKIVSKTKEEIN